MWVTHGTTRAGCSPVAGLTALQSLRDKGQVRKKYSMPALELVDKAMIVYALRKPTKHRTSGAKLPPPGFRPSIRPLSRTMSRCEEIAKTRSADGKAKRIGNAKRHQ